MSNKEKTLYNVRAVKNGFVCHQSHQVAGSPAEAIATAKNYAIAGQDCSEAWAAYKSAGQDCSEAWAAYKSAAETRDELWTRYREACDSVTVALADYDRASRCERARCERALATL